MPREYVGKVYGYKYTSYKKKKKSSPKKAPAKRRTRKKKSSSLMSKMKSSFLHGKTKLRGLQRSGSTKIFSNRY
jgi:hypothetical protein